MPVPSATLPVARRSLREDAVERIRTAIFDGTLKPGEHLNDGELQSWLGISRTPIREALNDLARVGLVEMAAQRYTRVALPDPGQRTELMQTLGAMLGGVVRVTVPGLGATQKKAIGRSIDQLRVVIDERDAAEYDRLSRSLFDAFIDACPNPTLVDATKDIINGLSYRVSVMTTPETIDWDTKLTAFPALSDALQSGDAVAAELAVEDVFRLSKSL